MRRATASAAPKPPLSVDAEAFASLPEGWRREARSRMAFLVMRGAVPALAFEKAVEAMRLEEQEHESPPSWDTLNVVCAAWPPPARHPADGQPRHGIFELASAVDSLASAHAFEGSQEDPRDVLCQFPACGVPAVLDAALAAFAARLRVLRPDIGDGEEADAEGGWEGAGGEAHDQAAHDPGGNWLDEADDGWFPD